MIHRRKVVYGTLLGLLLMSLLLLMLDLWISTPNSLVDSDIHDLFNLTREDGIGNWYASTLTFCIALVSWMIFLLARANRSNGLKVWLAVAILFTYMAVDDGSRVHERMGGYVETQLTGGAEDVPENLFPTYPWQMLFAPIFGLLGVLLGYIATYKTKKPMTRYAILCGLGLLVLALGMDALEGTARYTTAEFAQFVSDENPMHRHVLKALEETIESMGLGLILAGLLNYLATHFSNWKIKIQ